jgi:hypothetical protein
VYKEEENVKYIIYIYIYHKTESLNIDSKTWNVETSRRLQGNCKSMGGIGQEL